MKVFDLVSVIVRGTIINYIESGTMRELSYDQAKDRKVVLIVPDGDLKSNIFVDK